MRLTCTKVQKGNECFNFLVQNITTKVNSVMNELIKQLFTTNCPVTQLTEHKTEDPRSFAKILS